jgi:predicted negative regulator of RcsB-dependent stress response
MEMLKKYLPVMIIALAVYVGYDMYKKKKAERLAAAAVLAAAVVK